MLPEEPGTESGEKVVLESTDKPLFLPLQAKQSTFHPHLKPHCVSPPLAFDVESQTTHWKGARGGLLIDHEFQSPHCPWRSPDKFHIPHHLS